MRDALWRNGLWWIERENLFRGRRGTTVKFYLPRMMGAADDKEDAANALAPKRTCEEMILVLEDDDDVRMYSVDVLRHLGYRVLEAHDRRSALRLLERP